MKPPAKISAFWKFLKIFSIFQAAKIAKNIANKYDLIVSNPPYFQNSLYAPDEKRTNARHNSNLEFDDIIEALDFVSVCSRPLLLIQNYF